MDDITFDPALNDPLSLVGADPALYPPVGQLTSADGTTVSPAGVAGLPDGIVPQPEQLNPANLLGDLGSAIPGFGSVVSLLKVVTGLVGEIEKGVEEATIGHPITTLQGLVKFIGQGDKLLQLESNKLWDWIKGITIDQLYESYLRDGLGISVDKFEPDEKEAVKTIDSMLGFSVLVHFVASGIDAVGGALLANRWKESIGPIISSLPESMGLTWALGLAVDESFKAAQGVILEEAINKQKRPNRIQWPQVRTLLKQHAIEESEFDDLMKHQGFPDDHIKYLKRLRDVALPVADVAQLWYRDELSDEEAKKAIARLGFDDTETSQLFNLYMAKAENQASVTHRTVARQLYEAHLIAEDQYRAILTNANFPKRLIDEDIAAIQLVQDTGRLLHSVTEIKQRFQHAAISDKIARDELRELNYSDTYITELLQAWLEPPLRRTHGLSQAKILTYLISGALTADQARTQLTALGLDSTSVQFLIDHPSANAGVHQRARTPALVTAAFVDGLIPVEQLADAFKSTGVRDADIQWYRDIAIHKLEHKKTPIGPYKSLDKAEILDAWKYGLLHDIDAANALLSLGYSPTDSTLLLEIKNKGVIQPPRAPAFPSIAAAIQFLKDQGFTIYDPPDPQIIAAEGMALSAGYTVIAPEGTFGRGGGPGSTGPAGPPGSTP